MYFTAYPEKLEEYIPTSYKIRYIFEELYVAGYVNYKLAYKLYWPAESNPNLVIEIENLNATLEILWPEWG